MPRAKEQKTIVVIPKAFCHFLPPSRRLNDPGMNTKASSIATTSNCHVSEYDVYILSPALPSLSPLCLPPYATEVASEESCLQGLERCKELPSSLAFLSTRKRRFSQSQRLHASRFRPSRKERKEPFRFNDGRRGFA